MGIDTTPDFDLGPLTWVQGEIDQALTRGLEALTSFKAKPGDGTPLKHARAHIHQAAGAIQMVGLEAVTAYTDEVERQLSRLEEIDPSEVEATCELVDRACRKLKIFLDELVDGAAPVPLKLFPEYELMQQARGVKAASPTDLFYPDLSPRAPKIARSTAVTPQKLPSFLVKQRRVYQRGLLSWLRGDEEGARLMRDAVQRIEDVQTHSSQRSFWWAAGALLESIVEKGVDSGLGIKQLCGRVDLQIRRFVEGSSKVADRMRREVLYYVAISAPVGPQVQAVQRAYRLHGLIPSADVLSADVLRVQPHVREARDLLAAAKDLWLKLTGGRTESLPKLKQVLSALRDKTAAIGEPSLSKLASALAERLDKLPSGAIPESAAMEYATGLLLAESAVDNFATLSPEFPKQVDAMIARLDATGPVAGAAPPMLDKMAKRAQERLLLAQVAREIQANLRHMEQVLDAFFRDHEKRADLATLTHDSKQITGALRILGLEHAEQLLALCQQQIDEYAKPETAVADEDLELLAEALSGLGFYIEAVEQQRPDRERLIEPLLARRLGAPVKSHVETGDTVEDAVADLKAALPATLAAFQRAPDEPSVRERLAAELTTLKNDAELIGDASLQADADAALGLLARAGTGDTAELQEAIQAIAEGRAAAPAPAPSEETMRLVETDASELDRELLDIYLTEADEVLDNVGTSVARLKAQPDDREALTTARRGFHTLKGSGRMVGLTDLGEIAYEVEKIHNRLLEDEHVATPPVLAMIDTALTGFRVWVDTLRRKGRVKPDAKALRAAIATVEASLPTRELPITPISAAAAATPVAPPALPASSVPAIEVIELDETSQQTELESPSETLAETPLGNLIEFVTEHPAHEEPAAPIASIPTAEPEEVTVGGVTLSHALYRILCDEAQQHLTMLDAELQSLQFDPAATPSQTMVRASHTLCGIHRTAGFPLIASTAKAVEQCLLGLEERGAPLPSLAQPVLARAIAGLRSLTTRVRAREAFNAGDEVEAAEIVAELDALRHEVVPEATVDDIESAAQRAADQTQSIPVMAPRAEPLTVKEPSEPAPEARVIPMAPPPERLAATVVIAPAREPASTREPAKIEALPTALAAPPSLDPLTNVHDEVDEQVLPIFLEEAAELFPQAGEQLRTWRRSPNSPEPAHALRRTLHTFKGSARMAGAMRLGELTHLMESRLLVGDALVKATPDLFEALDTDLDHIAFVLDRLQKGEMNTALPWVAAEAAPAAAPVTPAPSAVPAASASPASAPLSVVAPALASPPPATIEAPAALTSSEAEGAQRAMLRVRADLIDRLVNEAGEVAIARARVEGELRSLKGNLLELTNSVIRLRSQVREIEIQAESQIQSQLKPGEQEFDPLEFDRFTRFQELTRGLVEGVNDVATVQQSLLRNIDDADAALLAQARLSRDVQQQLFSIRTVPFGSLSERLYRILRQTAKELDKRANLEIRGTQVELDRSVLEKLVGPLEHLLRNALDHGIEGRAERVKAGKPETGEIALNVNQQGNEIAIEITDDGAGLDFARIRDKARSQGLLTGDAEPNEARLIQCIFEPGFSTATKVTQISGRGVGMDVVRSDIAALGGRVEVASTAGKGSTFTLYLPLTLAVAQTVLVRAGGRLWALPAPMVEQVQQIKDQDLINLYLTREVAWQGRKYPFFYLPRLLGNVGHNPETLRYNSVVLLKSGQNMTAVHVDEMVGNQEVVVKNIGPQLARVSGVAGATVLGTGEVVLIINPVQLAQRTDTVTEAPAAIKTPDATQAAAAAAAGPPVVMVVDDSLTVRRITSRLLTREGFEVVTAKDGLDALQLLGDRIPDAMLLDIEMPRMDGFELAKSMKADPRVAHVPIIMITSRTAEKHRNHAKQLGIEIYLGKPYQEEELLRQLRAVLALHTA